MSSLSKTFSTQKLLRNINGKVEKNLIRSNVPRSKKILKQSYSHIKMIKTSLNIVGIQMKASIKQLLYIYLSLTFRSANSRGNLLSKIL